MKNGHDVSHHDWIRAALSLWRRLGLNSELWIKADIKLLKVCKRKTKRFIKAMLPAASSHFDVWTRWRWRAFCAKCSKTFNDAWNKKAEKNFFSDLNLIRHITLQEGKLLRLHGNRQARRPRAPWQENGVRKR